MSQYQHEDHFTVEEATELLPWLTERAGKVRDAFNSMEEKGFDIVTGKWKPKGNGYSQGPPPEEYDGFIKLVAELDRKGVVITNFKRGIFNIPHIRSNGDEVYLCWMLGEGKIGYWHGIADGFLERMPLEVEGTGASGTGIGE